MNLWSPCLHIQSAKIKTHGPMCSASFICFLVCYILSMTIVWRFQYLITKYGWILIHIIHGFIVKWDQLNKNNKRATGILWVPPSSFQSLQYLNLFLVLFTHVFPFYCSTSIHWFIQIKICLPLFHICFLLH